MNKKVYFAGSIRGGRVDENLYKEIIAYIKKTDVVLTEHVGDLTLSKFEKDEEYDEKIYMQDTSWIRECDILIAECTCPSFGVGYELAYAEKYDKPCYVFYNKQRSSLSAMIKGNKYYNIIPYDDAGTIFKKIDEILS